MCNACGGSCKTCGDPISRIQSTLVPGRITSSWRKTDLQNGALLDTMVYEVFDPLPPPKKKVKKWKWVGQGNTQPFISIYQYINEEHAKREMGVTQAIKIPWTEIEVDE